MENVGQNVLSPHFGSCFTNQDKHTDNVSLSYHGVVPEKKEKEKKT